jgi:hypothetical protein
MQGAGQGAPPTPQAGASSNWAGSRRRAGGSACLQMSRTGRSTIDQHTQTNTEHSHAARTQTQGVIAVRAVSRSRGVHPEDTQRAAHNQHQSSTDSDRGPAAQSHIARRPLIGPPISCAPNQSRGPPTHPTRSARADTLGVVVARGDRVGRGEVGVPEGVVPRVAGVVPLVGVGAEEVALGLGGGRGEVGGWKSVGN